MRQKKCTSCARLYGLGLFECPECHNSSCIVVSADDSDLGEKTVERSDWDAIESDGRWNIPIIRKVLFANGIALVVFILLASVVGYLRSISSGPTLALFAVVSLPVFGIIGVVNLMGVYSALVVLFIHKRYLKALILLALAVPPIAVMAIEFLRAPQ